MHFRYSDEDDSVPIDPPPSSKPITLDLHHPDDLIQKHPDQKTTRPSSASRPQNRSPSPSPASASRKSSFCSLFKSRETISQPDSPKTKCDKSGSVLSLFRPRSKSKSKSPVVEHKHRQQVPVQQKEPEEPVYIHIPLHTPTEEDLKSGVLNSRQDLEQVFGREVRSRKVNLQVQKKSPPSDGIRIPLHGPAVKQEDIMKVFESCKVDDKLKSDSVRIPIRTTTPEDLAADKSRDYIHIPLHTPPNEKPGACFAKVKISEKAPGETKKVVRIEENSIKGEAKTNRKTKCRRIPLPDGSIRIPLRSPSDEEGEVQTGEEQKKPEAEVNFDEVIKQVKEIQLAKQIEVKDDKVESPQEEKKKTKKRILFSTRLGSREEQVFSTQFSLSKTESQSSQPGSPEEQAKQEQVVEVEPAKPEVEVVVKPARKLFMSKRSLAQQILDYERDRVKAEDESQEINAKKEFTKTDSYLQAMMQADKVDDDAKKSPDDESRLQRPKRTPSSDGSVSPRSGSSAAVRRRAELERAQRSHRSSEDEMDDDRGVVEERPQSSSSSGGEEEGARRRRRMLRAQIAEQEPEARVLVAEQNDDSFEVFHIYIN